MKLFKYKILVQTYMVSIYNLYLHLIQPLKKTKKIKMKIKE